jgi:hypothetical protein
MGTVTVPTVACAVDCRRIWGRTKLGRGPTVSIVRLAGEQTVRLYGQTSFSGSVITANPLWDRLSGTQTTVDDRGRAAGREPDPRRSGSHIRGHAVG